MPRARGASSVVNTPQQTYVRNGVRKTQAASDALLGSELARGLGRSRKRFASDSAAAGVPANPARTGLLEQWNHPKLNVEARVFLGDCRAILPTIPEVQQSKLDLVFADPPFNWKRGYDKWDDSMAETEYLTFTYDWIDLCLGGLRPGGSLWINIPDDWAAEIACYMKGRFERKPPHAVAIDNWCVWHFRFGQNAVERFINSKVHALHFIKGGAPHTWNAHEVLEVSVRASP